MDALTHIFLPLILIYVLKREYFNPNPLVFSLALFALLPDVDKFLGMSGLLHSLLTLVPTLAASFLLERKLSGTKRYSLIITFFVLTHLLLDFLGDGIVPLLYPLVKSGVGLRYPIQIVFGEGSLGAMIRGSIEITKTAPEPGFHAYESLITGYGVAASLVFLTIFVKDRLRGRSEGEG
ncbi:hypothetical protein AKJ57_00460 [candidate division MSBL1 archaeon SCGC-AAA259A05]|uniref:Metal-dependent hydrolase n=1 Tax=candidate division MSBL1 archaeon SCGC-AAA259A05 TaxID=1698259 RepID=A0A133UBS8_9EURY|nr:hypothetical protein AKJ57_00460 [candidate division MSBL1 archaeon SCGC-AAA259A05]